MIGFGIVERNADVYFLAVTCASACSPDTMATLHRMDPAGRVTAIASIAVPLSSGQPYAHLAVGTAGVFVLSANEIWFTDGAIPLGQACSI